MGEGSSKKNQRLRDYKWHPFLPVVALLVLFHLFMPSAPGTSFWELAIHQQAISLSTLPTLLASMYWFAKANGLDENLTPEERILDEQ